MKEYLFVRLVRDNDDIKLKMFGSCSSTYENDSDRECNIEQIVKDDYYLKTTIGDDVIVFEKDVSKNKQ